MHFQLESINNIYDMTNFITHVKDRLGNNYLGVKIPHNLVEPHLDNLKDLIGELDFEEFTKNQKTRDGGQYHLTVINVMDYNRLMKEMGVDNFVNSLDKVLTTEIDDLRMVGVGTAAKMGNRAYFIVCKSDKLGAIRKRFELPDHDFHVTLGFKEKDVFGVRKNQILKKGDKFSQLLKMEFNKNYDWSFIKEIPNFDLDKSKEVIPVEVTKTNIKFKCGSHYIVVGYLEDGEKFWIVSKWEIDEDLPRLPETEIAKILNEE
jgi:hypothetical protein